MAEISREEYIEEITKWLNCTNCDSDECLGSVCVECQHHYEEYDFEKALRKAISDMQKLDKIEQMIDECRPFPDDMADCLIEIEQIIKGGDYN